jgi:hypothetical protein
VSQFSQVEPLDPESQRWLEADLGGDLPEYDWGPAGIPEDKPIRYEPGTGLVVESKTRGNHE